MKAEWNNILSFCRSKRFVCILFSSCFILFNLGCCYTLSHGSKVAVAVGATFALCILLCYLVTILPRTEKLFTEARVFLLFLIPLGCFYLIVFPPFSVPDEISHYKGAYFFSNLFLLSDLSYMRPEDAQLLSALSTRVDRDLYASVLENFSFFSQLSGKESYASILNSSAEAWSSFIPKMPQVRICAAFGIALGRLFGLGAIPTLYLGRLLNFACFVVLVYWAVKTTPVGKRIFMMICLLPMTLHVAASYSYDAATIGLAFLLTALFLKAIYATETLSVKQLVVLAVLSVLLAPCKVVYITIVLLVLLIPKNKFSNNRFSVIYKLGILGVSLFTTIVIRRIPSLINDSTSLSTSNFYTFSDIANDPVSFIGIIMKTFNKWGEAWLQGIFGGSLGWFQVSQPWFTLFGFFVLLLLAIPTYKNMQFHIKKIQRIFFLAIPVISWFLIMLVMYVSWTPNNENTILGVQGRYILPVLPLTLLAFKGDVLFATRIYSRSLVFAAGVMNAAFVARMFSLILIQ